MIHKLKTWPEYFEAVDANIKTFEVRKNDRDYQVGDELVLQSWDPFFKEYTGATIAVHVTYILADPQFVKEGFVIMGIGHI